MRVNCGTVGISNLTKRHRGTKKCLELKARRDKKGKGMVQGSLLTFMKPKPTLVPPMVAGTSLIQSNTTPTSLSTANSPLQWEFEDRDNHGRGHLLENRPKKQNLVHIPQYHRMNWTQRAEPQAPIMNPAQTRMNRISMCLTQAAASKLSSCQ
jgi:hypothetical protein